MLHYFKNQHGTIPILQTANVVIKREPILTPTFPPLNPSGKLPPQ